MKLLLFRIGDRIEIMADTPRNRKVLKNALVVEDVISVKIRMNALKLNSVFWNVGDEFNLDGIEKKAIRACLKKVKGNKSRAARMLGITVKTLYNKLEKYGIEKS